MNAHEEAALVAAEDAARRDAVIADIRSRAEAADHFNRLVTVSLRACDLLWLLDRAGV